MGVAEWIAFVAVAVSMIGSAVVVATKLGKLSEAVAVNTKNQDTLFAKLNTLPCSMQGERIAKLETGVANHEARITRLEV